MEQLLWNMQREQQLLGFVMSVCKVVQHRGQCAGYNTEQASRGPRITPGGL